MLSCDEATSGRVHKTTRVAAAAARSSRSVAVVRARAAWKRFIRRHTSARMGKNEKEDAPERGPYLIFRILRVIPEQRNG